jgi:hypothetical protein
MADQSSEDRLAMIRRIKSEIIEGTYITDDKLAAAAERLLEVLREEDPDLP